MVAKIGRVILWLGAAAYVVAGVVTISGAVGQTGHAASLGRAHIFWGSLLLGVGVFAGYKTFRGNKSGEWPGPAAGALCLGLLVALYAAFWIDMEGAEVKRRQSDEEVRSGRYHFGEQPALLAVAQAIAAPKASRSVAQTREQQVYTHCSGFSLPVGLLSLTLSRFAPQVFCPCCCRSLFPRVFREFFRR